MGDCDEDNRNFVNFENWLCRYPGLKEAMELFGMSQQAYLDSLPKPVETTADNKTYPYKERSLDCRTYPYEETK